MKYENHQTERPTLPKFVPFLIYSGIGLFIVLVIIIALLMFSGKSTEPDLTTQPALSSSSFTISSSLSSATISATFFSTSDTSQRDPISSPLTSNVTILTTSSTFVSSFESTFTLPPSPESQLPTTNPTEPVLTTVLPPQTTGQEDSPTPHVHSYTMQITEKEPTCAQKGVAHVYCACGAYKTKEIPTLRHTFSSPDVVLDATCTSDGKQTVKCYFCKVIVIQSIPAHGHDWEWIVTQEPTDETLGIRIKKCLKCEVIDATQTFPADNQTPVTTDDIDLLENRIIELLNEERANGHVPFAATDDVLQAMARSRAYEISIEYSKDYLPGGEPVISQNTEFQYGELQADGTYKPVRRYDIINVYELGDEGIEQAALAFIELLKSDPVGWTNILSNSYGAIGVGLCFDDWAPEYRYTVYISVVLHDKSYI